MPPTESNSYRARPLYSEHGCGCGEITNTNIVSITTMWDYDEAWTGFPKNLQKLSSPGLQSLPRDQLNVHHRVPNVTKAIQPQHKCSEVHKYTEEGSLLYERIITVQ